MTSRANRNASHELNQLTGTARFLERRAKKPKSFSRNSPLSRAVIGAWEKHRSDLEEARFFLDVAQEEKSEEALNEAAAKIATVSKELAQTELTQLLGGPDDRRNAIVNASSRRRRHGGAGLGRNTIAHVSALVRPARLSERDSRISTRRRSGR